MPGKRRKRFNGGLMTLAIGQVIWLGGCGSNDTQLASDQGPPKNQAEGLKRLREGNLKHDETAPPNQKSVGAPANQRSVAARRW